MDSWASQRKYFHHLLEPAPCVTWSLASPVEPLEQHPKCFVPEAVDTSEVVRNAVVLVVSAQFQVKLIGQVLEPEMPVILYPQVHFRQLRPHFLLGRLPLDPEPAFLAFGAVVREPEEVESLRLPRPPLFSVFLREPPELYQPRLAWL